MLVLSRKRSEEIRIGESIRVVVVKLDADRVKLGIDAPAEVPVHRQEVAIAIQEDRGSADGESC